MILLKMELLNQRNEKEAVYTELTLDQFYTLFHELKRANSLMNMVWSPVKISENERKPQPT